MSISGIGSQNIYIYNSQTKRLAAKDGSKDAFVDYFNGDISADEDDSLNGFDARRKYDIERMIWIWSSEEKGNILMILQKPNVRLRQKMLMRQSQLIT